MYFKRLELYGFKSFAERTVLEFEPGITAIVGPNGCGKSNIADAIKWVLGEQNPRELRGAKMEDVIFNGTHLKEPVNFAEVSLTLSNEGKIFPIDYAEITVSRRLFRSGESEYLLNKVPVRLKDIQELFLGTGIGTSAYSLLEQGKIDLILSSRAEDRRFVFEEAAGITKFKSQKREALRKLEDTENNLIRVNDIISEVNRQISSLERQAKKAQRYQEIFNILKEKEIKYNKYLILQWEDKKKDLLREKETLQKEEEEFLKRLHCGEEQIREKRVGLEKLEEEISLEEVNRTGIETSLEKNLSRIALNRERIKELNERNLSLEAENKVLGEKIENDKNNLQELRNQFEDFCRSEAEKKAELKDKQDWLEKINREIKENEDLLSNSRLQLIEINQAMTKLRNDLTKLSTENHSLQARLRRLELEKTKAEEEKGRLNSLFREREKIVEEKKSLLENKLKYLQELDKEINRLGKQEESLNEDFQKKEIEQRALASRIEILEEMRRCYEGYSPGVKSLMLAKKNGDLPEAEIIGVLAELIEVESGYERLVEVVLGNYVQTILVKDDKSFSLCLDYIKKNKLSEINFLILEGLEKEVVPANNLGEGFNYLIDFVHLPAPYEFILPHLFAETILVNTLEEGLQLKKEKRDLSFRWVTPQGEMGERNFVKSAPLPAEEGIAIVGREKRIKDLKNELVHIEEEKKEIFAKREAISQELEKNKQDLLKTKEEEHLLEIELSNLGQEMERMQKDLKRIEDELSVLVLEIEETSQEIKSRTEEIEKAGGDLKDLELKEQKIKNLLEETSHNQEEKNVLREKFC
ncbi:MAG: chromosome segregation protein SMC [Candidatus Omnitrophica bacterium]|nr:chromosome segregation protein SMC [Candidatus Omnitrophota bacterium]